MGVHVLSPLLEGDAREVVDLRDCCDCVVLVDRHFLMHKVVHMDDAAEALVLDKVEVPLFENCATELWQLINAGCIVVAVFDGTAPPGKQRISQEKSEHRETAKRSFKEAPLRREPRAHVRHWATKAVSFNSLVTAKIAKRLSGAIQGIDYYISLFEADPQTKLMEATFT